MNIETFSAIILQGENTSNEIDLGDKIFCGFQMPAAFNGSHLLYEATQNGTDFFKFEQFLVFANDFIRFDPAPYSAVRRLRVRSISSGPVNQDAERLIQIIGRSFGCSINIAC